MTKAISVGSFVFSRSAMGVLDQLQKTLTKLNASDMDTYAFLDARVKAFDTAIEQFIPLARKDLAAN